MGATLNQQMVSLATEVAKVAGGAALLAIIILALINMWAVLDPRMGQMVKGGLVRVALSIALIAGAVAAGAAGMVLSAPAAGG